MIFRIGFGITIVTMTVYNKIILRENLGNDSNNNDITVPVVGLGSIGNLFVKRMR